MFETILYANLRKPLMSFYYLVVCSCLVAMSSKQLFACDAQHRIIGCPLLYVICIHFC